MSAGWSIKAELVRNWRWRCLDEDILVPGSELCIVNSNNGLLVRLADSGATQVERDDLRHACGGPVVPVAPLKAEQG